MTGAKQKVCELYKLMEQISLDINTKEGKMIAGILDVLTDLADRQDLDAKVEEGFYVCPNCNESILIDQQMFETQQNIMCPKCREPLSIFTHEF